MPSGTAEGQVVYSNSTVAGGLDEFSVSCKIKKGDCNLPLSKEGGDKEFFADCNNGDIYVEFVK